MANEIDMDTGEVVFRGPFVRSAFNYDTDAASLEAGQRNDLPTVTQQQFKDEVDINTIVERFGLGHELPESFRAPEFGDFSDVGDFQSAQNAVIAAQEAFMDMPAGMRARFNNSPQVLMEFLGNRENLEEARKMGLLKPETPVGSGEATPAA